MCSIIVHKILVSEMGRLLLFVFSSLPLIYEVAYASFHSISSFLESIAAWNMCFKHKADIMTSTNRSGSQILPFGILIISLIAATVVTSIRSALVVSSWQVCDICWSSQAHSTDLEHIW